MDEKMVHDKLVRYAQNLFRADKAIGGGGFDHYTLTCSGWNYLSIGMELYYNNSGSITKILFVHDDYYNLWLRPEDDLPNAKKKVIEFIANVMKASSFNDDILSWPVNCNIAYVKPILDELKENL